MNVLIIILVCIVAVRLLIPTIALYFVNRTLRKINNIQGKATRVRINLVSRKIVIQGLAISKRDIATGIDTITLVCSEIEFNFKWIALLRRQIDGEVIVKNPKLVYAQVLIKAKENIELKTEQPVTSIRKTLLASALLKMPKFDINLTIKNGCVRYINHTIESRIDVALDALSLSVENFSNKLPQSDKQAKVKLDACVYEGRLTAVMDFLPLEGHLTFNLHAELHDANAMLLNDFFKAYAQIDVSSGTFGVETAIVAKNGSFTGYVNPILTSIQILGKSDKNDSFFKKIWEHAMAFVVKLVEDKKADEIAIKIPIEGRLDIPGVSVFTAMGDSIGNAFLESLWCTMRRSINLRSVFNYALSGTAGLIRKALS